MLFVVIVVLRWLFLHFIGPLFDAHELLQAALRALALCTRCSTSLLFGRLVRQGRVHRVCIAGGLVESAERVRGGRAVGHEATGRGG